ncbi:MAG: CRISPR-associated endonuclease Cas1, partial [Candidatus Margulisiibacteriota bacterium]
MRKLLNTLYITTQGAYLNKEGETVVVTVEKEKRLQVPIHALEGVVCFGQVSCSPFLLGHCAEHGVTVTFLSENGYYLASVNGLISGNVLLRRQQYRLADNLESCATVARFMLMGKIANGRTVLQRSIRDHTEKVNHPELETAISRLSQSLEQLKRGQVFSLDELRGIEGDSAHSYFAGFDHLIVQQKQDFQ